MYPRVLCLIYFGFFEYLTSELFAGLLSADCQDVKKVQQMLYWENHAYLHVLSKGTALHKAVSC